MPTQTKGNSQRGDAIRDRQRRVALLREKQRARQNKEFTIRSGKR